MIKTTINAPAPSLPDVPARTRAAVRLIELHGARRFIDRLAANPFVLGECGLNEHGFLFDDGLASARMQ